jgi:hypothetical protein
MLTYVKDKQLKNSQRALITPCLSVCSTGTHHLNGIVVSSNSHIVITTFCCIVMFLPKRKRDTSKHLNHRCDDCLFEQIEPKGSTVHGAKGKISLMI